MSHFNYVESFSIVESSFFKSIRVSLNVLLLSLSLCYVVESFLMLHCQVFFVMLSHVPLNYHINVVSFLI